MEERQFIRIGKPSPTLSASGRLPISLMPGCVSVRMAEQDQFARGSTLLLTDDTFQLSARDVGVVEDSTDLEFDAGDVVAVLPRSGKWLNVGENQFRLYGVNKQEDGIVAKVAVSAQIPAKIQGERLVMTGSSVLIARDPMPDQVGLIHLPSDARSRNGQGTVLEVGPKCKILEPGQRVIYTASAYAYVFVGAESFGEYYACDPRDLMVVDESHVLGVLE